MKYTIEGYDDSDKNAIPLIGTVSVIMNASDKAFTNVEQTLHKHLSADVDRHLGLAPACSLRQYLETRPSEKTGETGKVLGGMLHDELSMQFAGDQYFVAKRVSLAFKFENFLLQQKLFLDCWHDLSGHFNEKGIECSDDISQSNLYSVCAEYASILQKRGIVVFPSVFENKDTEDKYKTGVLVSATVALIATVATYSDIENIQSDSELIYRNCVSLVGSRYEQIEAMFVEEEGQLLFEEFLAKWTCRIS